MQSSPVVGLFVQMHRTTEGSWTVEICSLNIPKSALVWIVSASWYKSGPSVLQGQRREMTDRWKFCLLWFVVVVVFKALSRFVHLFSSCASEIRPVDGDTFQLSPCRPWNDATQSAWWDGRGIVAGRDALGFVLLLTEINDPASIFTFNSTLSHSLSLLSVYVPMETKRGSL